MSALREAQRLLAAALDQDAGPAERRLHALIAPGPGGPSPPKQVAIYRDSSRRARERALEAIYPVSRQLLGERCFAALGAAYLTRYPSSGPDLNGYGADFPRYLEAQVHRHAALAPVPYLADLTRLEWHWHAAYYAPDDRAFDPERFAALMAAGQAEQVRFRLSAALRLLASAYPVREIWRRHREGDDTGAVAMGDGDRLVIHRVGFRPQIDPVAPERFDLLRALAEGNPLGALADAGLAVERIPELIAARWVVGCAIDGVV